MKVLNESLETKWQALEASISHPRRSLDYNLEWGSLRESFYEDNGGTLPLTSTEEKRLRTLQNHFQDERVFILGNGPSLNRTPLELLENEYTFVTNRAYLLFDRLKWRPTFYTALDWRVVPDVAHEINMLTGIVCFFEKRFQSILRDGSDVFWYTHGPARRSEDKIFSYNIHEGVRGAGSVIGACIQIAFYLGFREIYLLGCDLGYKVTGSVKQDGDDRFGTGVKHQLTSTADDDPNHFDPRYFGANRRWHDPNVKRMISGHEQCLKGVTEAGGKIFNATIGGQLEVYPRANFRDLFPSSRRKTAPRDEVRQIINNVSPIELIPHGSETLIGPMLRMEHAHIDETDAVASYLNAKTRCGFMIDIGAHHGTALSGFLDSGWKICAFEPDSANRSKLQARLAAHKNAKNVTLDTRCVSKSSESNLPFYSSEESTGISGLSAFRDTHREAQRVDTVSLKDYFAGQDMPAVDFLKIDTEGHDLFVLQGFPWDRNKPRVIECEFEDLKTKPLGYTTKDMADFLIGKGYTVYVSEWHPILRYGQKHDWHRLQQYPCALASEEAWGNLLAFAQAPDEQELIAAVKGVLTLGKKSRPPTPAAPLTLRLPSSVTMETPGFQASPHFRKDGHGVWRLRSDPNPKIPTLVANFRSPKTEGLQYSGLVVVSSDKAVRLRLFLSRAGSSPYEGSAKEIEVLPNEWHVASVRHSFKKSHQTIKLQVEVVGRPSEANLQINNMLVFESVAELFKHTRINASTARTANRLFREGKYAESAMLCALGAREPGLAFLKFNAQLSLRRMGIADDQVVGEILAKIA